MPKYSVFNLASASVLVPGDIHVTASTRWRNAATTLADDGLHPGLLLGREIALGVHPSRRRRSWPTGSPRARVARASSAAAARSLRRHAAPGPARRTHAAARRHSVDGVKAQIVLPRLPAAATRPAPPRPSPRWAARRRTLPACANPAAAKKADQSMPGASRAKSARVHRLSALWSLADASRVAWLCAMAVSSAITASARCVRAVEAGERQQAADVLLVSRSQRLHARLGAEVVLAVRQAEPALQQEGDVGLLAVDARLHRQAQQVRRVGRRPSSADRRRRAARCPAAGSAPPCPERDRCCPAAA